ncbi:MAG: glutamate 5-kinase [Gammaproteobacteria bacterium]|nr:MAG: glutamate 5-kinase [Gammaproteobacteria bacterium]UCH41871.1 MAG: glutamate 5-kinase [Gammaproteobacteria bacterium]
MNRYKKVVVKIGSALITDSGKGLDRGMITTWAEQMAQLRAAGVDVVLVSSGSIAEGITRLGLKSRPKNISELQATAAVGQMGLVQAYEACFQAHGLHSAQILLTHADLSNRRRYLNARTTLRTLLEYGTVPVVNENDSVSNEEIRFGDNDTLGALVANLIEADLLIILTDQPGLFDANPVDNPEAKLIERADARDPKLAAYAGPSSGALGRGGMQTKVSAAQLAARSGTHTVIACGKLENVITRLVQGEALGSFLEASEGHLAARKQWLAGHMRCVGELCLDDGAVNVLLNRNASLLPIGVKAVKGVFNRGEVVACLAPDGSEIARGLVNYPSDECKQIIGKDSRQIPEILGYQDDPELINRENLILTKT